MHFSSKMGISQNFLSYFFEAGNYFRPSADREIFKSLGSGTSMYNRNVWGRYFASPSGDDEVRLSPDKVCPKILEQMNKEPGKTTGTLADDAKQTPSAE
jgi:hypothetical protein